MVAIASHLARVAIADVILPWVVVALPAFGQAGWLMLLEKWWLDLPATMTTILTVFG